MIEYHQRQEEALSSEENSVYRIVCDHCGEKSHWITSAHLDPLFVESVLSISYRSDRNAMYEFEGGHICVPCWEGHGPLKLLRKSWLDRIIDE